MSHNKAQLAFEILARENSRMLTAYLRTLVADEAVIDDLFQEAMIVAWRELQAAAASIRQLDTNRDGIVSREEAQGQSRGLTGGSRLGGYQTPPPVNDVPKHDFNIIVGRLTDRSATVRVLFHNTACCRGAKVMSLIRSKRRLLGFGSVFVVIASCNLAVRCSAAERPNFVFIQGEGQGWASTSVQLDPAVPESKSHDFWTPNLERLASF